MRTTPDLSVLSALGFGPGAALTSEPKLFVDRRFLSALMVELERELAVEGAQSAFFQIGFKSNGGWTGTMDLGIDNMFVSGSTVPEPSTLALFGLAAACMVVQRRARKSS